MADPGFFPGGGANSQKCYYFSIFCRKLHENERIWTPGGGARPWRPPWIRQWLLINYEHSFWRYYIVFHEIFIMIQRGYFVQWYIDECPSMIFLQTSDSNRHLGNCTFWRHFFQFLRHFFCSTCRMMNEEQRRCILSIWLFITVFLQLIIMNMKRWRLEKMLCSMGNLRDTA